MNHSPHDPRYAGYGPWLGLPAFAPDQGEPPGRATAAVTEYEVRRHHHRPSEASIYRIRKATRPRFVPLAIWRALAATRSAGIRERVPTAR